MNKFIYLIRRIKSLDYKEMFDTVNKVNRRTRKFKVVIFIDMVWCGFKYMAGYMDYYIFGMYNLNAKQRKTVMTRGKNDKYIKYFNDPNYWYIVHNKDEFNQKFSKYIKRDWLYLGDNKEEFCQFIKNKKYIIVKPRSGTCGKGIEKINLTKFKADKLYNYLLENKLVIIEDVVSQHHVMNKLHPNSVNTIRVITILHNGITHVVAAYMRIGNGKVVDNFNSGGMVVPVDVEEGIIKYPALDKAGHLYKQHPLTRVGIIGFKVPLWNKVLELVNEATKEIPELGIMGWDVAITKEGPLLIEANQYPGHDIYQLPPHTENGIGMLPVFEAIVKLK
jgi:glutathione synthase/RimK-type ligase-like ATP-grasp enzyme